MDLTKSKSVFPLSVKWHLLCGNNALKCAGFPGITFMSFVLQCTAVAKRFLDNILAGMADRCTLYLWWQGQVVRELHSLFYNATSISNFSPTFQDNLPVPSSGLKNPKELDS